jgi:signal peptidase I
MNRLPEVFLLLLVVMYCITLPSLLKRAGKESNLSFIPLLQFIPFLKAIQRPWYWFLLLLIPGVNLIMLVIMNVELGIAFGKRSTKDQWFFGALPWAALYMLAFKNKDAAYIGPRDWTGKKKSFLREWGEALVFAVVAASVIRGFFLEAFTIPTPSMEKSMLVGDYLFVSKMSYGAKIPQTPVSVPFVHNALPGSMTNSYVEWFSLPYMRLPGFGEVERFDPVVFNFPNGDSILVDPYYAGHDYHALLREEAMYMADNNYTKFMAEPDRYYKEARKNFQDKKQCYVCGLKAGSNRPMKIGGVKHRPIDKKENYIKRCIGLPGETLEIVNRQVKINGAPIENPNEMMWNYSVAFKSPAALKRFANEFSILQQDLRSREVDMLGQAAADSMGNAIYRIPFTAAQAEELKKSPDVSFIEVSNDQKVENNYMQFYPNSPLAPFQTWTVDNYGPIHIPAKGETIDLTPENIALYRRVIEVYEENKWEEKDGAIYINGNKADKYTFSQDYYWLMGDNRHNSADSRFWGFVPENHVVGKAVFTWFSKENMEYHKSSKIRWNRMFRLVD